MTKSIAIIVNLDDSHIHALELMFQGEEPQPEKLSAITTSHLRELAQGGALIEAEQMDYLRKAGLPEDAELFRLVEQALGRKRGKLAFECTLDPAYERFFRDQARIRGISIERLIQESYDSLLRKGLFYTSLSDTPTVLFTRSQLSELQRLTGHDHITGADVMEFLHDAIRLASKDDDEAMPLIGVARNDVPAQEVRSAAV